ncbi:MAG TPA: neutral zinc metallopeptidase [Pirellulaceae bacterium]|nr:neutral zinc metallopeptidase [Pirellulaceae bacterium]HMO90890.1 neutral zinc metallopeptidase [Pirellulaceae bacterium]HMP68634.1 neutral zinc metallopeptidase [Pirellulaceae bacterium]
MKWKGRETSKNVEDRRGIPPQVAVGGGLIGLIIIGIAILFNVDPQIVQQFLDAQGQGQAPQAGQAAGKDDEYREFIGVILRDTESVWRDIFKNQLSSSYQEPKLVIFENEVASGCGRAPASVGPFYCPADQKIYIDPSFFRELAVRHKAPGDFAAAYVLAHEVAHHVQLLTGYSDQVNKVRRQGNERESNRASVRLELQADYLAGVWAHHAHKKYDILEPGDIETAITAANQIGDDRLQKMATGYVIPDRFTHGTSKQRAFWFTKGLKSGDFNAMRQLFELNYDEL